MGISNQQISFIVRKKRETSMSICLIDFGHAKIIESNGWSIDIQGAHGTLAFMSTGAMAGKPLTPLDDLESLAYTLFYLVTKTLPWCFENDNSECMAVMGIKVMVEKMNPLWCQRCIEFAVQNKWS
jgi:serine/threonine protein kinase